MKKDGESERKTSALKKVVAERHHVRKSKSEKPLIIRRKKWFFSGLAVVVILAVYLFFALPKVTVDIHLRGQEISLRETIIADAKISSVDSAQKAMPATYLSAQKEIIEKFTSTGNASNEGRASGEITIFNKADSLTSVTLREGTRFLSDSGHLFLLERRVVVPPGKRSGGVVTPGSVAAQVEAAEGGSGYNIGSANFSVPGLRGSDLYFTVFASSSQAMSGGYDGEVKKITSLDIQRAEEKITESLTAKALEELKEKFSSSYGFSDKTLDVRIITNVDSVKEGSVQPEFEIQGSIELRVLAFAKSDLDNLAKNLSSSQVIEDMVIKDDKTRRDYSFSGINFQDGSMQVIPDYIFYSYEDINKNDLALSLSGKNTDQINQMLHNLFPGALQNVKVNFWPFWVSKAPRSQKAVHINIYFE